MQKNIILAITLLCAPQLTTVHAFFDDVAFYSRLERNLSALTENPARIANLLHLSHTDSERAPLIDELEDLPSPETKAQIRERLRYILISDMRLMTSGEASRDTLHSLKELASMTKSLQEEIKARSMANVFLPRTAKMIHTIISRHRYQIQDLLFPNDEHLNAFTPQFRVVAQIFQDVERKRDTK